MTAGCLILGGGHGGFHTANALREAGYRDPITLIDASSGLPYERPPLSKKFLLGELDRGGLDFRPAHFYASAAITLRTGTTAVQVDRAAHRVRLRASGRPDEWLDYDTLVFATGSRPRPLSIPGADHPAVHRLATAADAEALGAALGHARRAVVYGSGFVGLESAAVATARGIEVTMLHRGRDILSRSVTAPTAEYIRSWHESQGVVFVPGRTVTHVRSAPRPAAGRAVEVRDTEGTVHPADLVIVGIGAEPDTRLAESAGLEVDGGIVVDGTLRTADPAVYAVGDCARFPHGLYRAALRLESVQNATDHARTLARALTGTPDAYRAVPWFWSDQGELKLQIAGLTARPDTTVVRGDPASGRFSVFAYRSGQLAGVDSIRRAADHVLARKLLAHVTTPTVDEAADESFALRDLLPTSPPAHP